MIQSKLKLKKSAKVFLGIISILLLLFLICISYFFISRARLNKIGYSNAASYNIIVNFRKDVAYKYPNNKTLNAAFESSDFKESNIDIYAKVAYYNHKHLIRNINLLVDKKYNTRDISIILAHGTDNDIYEFSKLEKVKYLEAFYSYDFAKIKNYDRYVSYMDVNGDDEETTIIKVNMNLDKDVYTDPVTINDYSKTVIANKHYYLGEDYIPKDLVAFPREYTLDGDTNCKGTKEAVNAAIKMMDAARKEGLNLLINSAYRSYSDQDDVYNRYLKLYGNSYVDNYVVKPGFSEHQTGYAFDFASGNSSIFANSKEYKWMIKNSYKYGFVYRFLKGKEEITQIKHEPWHYRYVGEEIALVMDKKELSFEEYYAIYLDK